MFVCPTSRLVGIQASNTNMARNWSCVEAAIKCKCGTCGCACGGSYQRQTTVTRVGQVAAIVVNNDQQNKQAGAVFNWIAPTGSPLEADYLILSGWSKAEADSGGADDDYSLYVDMIHSDGKLGAAGIAPFTPGAHDWEYVQKKVVLSKPIAQLRIYCLFRSRIGKVYFESISCKELEHNRMNFVCINSPALQLQLILGSSICVCCPRVRSDSSYSTTCRRGKPCVHTWFCGC
eukprot:SAG31_NODE_9855_length_1220_cov_1.151650_1_plen_233_part_00